MQNIAFYTSLVVSYFFLLSYVSDKHRLNNFGLSPDTHSRSFHQHVTQGFQIVMRPIYLILLMIVTQSYLFAHEYFWPDMSPLFFLPAVLIITAASVGWFNAKSTATVIKNISEPYTTLILKHRDDPVFGTVILQDSIKIIFYQHERKNTLVTPWSEVSEYKSKPDRTSCVNETDNA